MVKPMKNVIQLKVKRKMNIKASVLSEKNNSENIEEKQLDEQIKKLKKKLYMSKDNINQQNIYLIF